MAESIGPLYVEYPFPLPRGSFIRGARIIIGSRASSAQVQMNSLAIFMSPYLAVQTNVIIQRLLIVRRQRDVVLGNVHELL